jgi:pilus assembly protein FimV
MGLDFDLGDFDLSGDTMPPHGTTPGSSLPADTLDFGDFGLDVAPKPKSEAAPSPAPAPGDSDPLARKLELAEEFRQIGDLEGARDLLEEVVAKADGALRSKAQGMLDTLG